MTAPDTIADIRTSLHSIPFADPPKTGFLTLEMIDLPGKAICYDCIKTVEIEDRLDPCPECGGGKLLPEGGDEMRIKDMEVQ